MAYRVKIMPRAQRDLMGIYDWIGGASSDAAALRRPSDGSLRHLLYGNRPHIYRVIYRVIEKEKQVDVLHLRHGARQEFKTSELNA